MSITHCHSSSLFHSSSVSSGHAGLTIDLSALRYNYCYVRDKIGHDRICAGVVKANAYGLGAVACAQALFQEGCRHFFVAYLDEALEVKAALQTYSKDALDDTHIYVFNGCMLGEEDTFAHEHIIPVLTCPLKLARWSKLSRSRDHKLPAVIHIDTGINRTGLRADELLSPALCDDLNHVDVRIIMSHFASSDDIHSAFNAIQRDRFYDTVEKLVLNLGYRPKLSLANSNAIGQLDASHWGDIVRPGSALYGLSPSFSTQTRPVLSLWSTIFQEKFIKKGESVGYAQTYYASRDMRLGIVAIGYADGVSRRTNQNGDAPYAMIHDHKAPIIGRISMDVLALDITDIPPHLTTEGSVVEFINKDISVDQFAVWVNTFVYEAQLYLGGRLKKKYINNYIE